MGKFGQYIKKYWWAVLILLIVVFFVWRKHKAKKDAEQVAVEAAQASQFEPAPIPSATGATYNILQQYSTRPGTSRSRPISAVKASSGRSVYPGRVHVPSLQAIHAGRPKPNVFGNFRLQNPNSDVSTQAPGAFAYAKAKANCGPRVIMGPRNNNNCYRAVLGANA